MASSAAGQPSCDISEETKNLVSLVLKGHYAIRQIEKISMKYDDDLDFEKISMKYDDDLDFEKISMK